MPHGMAQLRAPVFLGVTMMGFGAINFVLGMSLIGERGSRNRVRVHPLPIPCSALPC